MAPLLTTAFCPPVEYFAVLARYSSVYMEACENYVKQSWRNRCRILTANGPMDLTVPVSHRSGEGQVSEDASLTLGPTACAVPPLTMPRVARSSEACPSPDRKITEVRVDYSTPWVAKFERAVESAYYSSPFFIYYKDALWEILDSHPPTLWELNGRLTAFFCEKIGIAPQIIATADFIPPGPLSPGGMDLREVIHPKRKNTILADLGLDRPYWQVFRERFGFVPGMSIMDLLFNEGPESICWLR